ncbi:MAG: antibiotic biosynthesis monooxygenase family protein [Novosphingobium sp.]
MDLEIAIVSTKDDNAAAMIDAMYNQGGIAALESAPGCRKAKVLPGVENPGKVVFLVEWDSVEAHAAGKDSEGFRNFLKIAGPFFGSSASMEHFRDSAT